jgi:hypothetical protein
MGEGTARIRYQQTAVNSDEDFTLIVPSSGTNIEDHFG